MWGWGGPKKEMLWSKSKNINYELKQPYINTTKLQNKQAN